MRFRKFFYLIFIIVIFCSLQGCASIIHGSSQRVKVTSDPSEAKVKHIDTSNTYTTPANIKLARKHDHMLVISKEGYQKEEVTIMHVVSGAVAGNIIAGGLIGWGVDAMTGAQYRLVPENVSVELEPLEGSESVSTTSSTSAKMTPEERLENLKELRKKELISEKEYKAMRKIILKKVTGEKK